ncbi:MAG: hypothetical protein IKG97_00050 [Lachnospiraceae bacterium]|nr:hypothetical protein [Lachnospiraceae bacterium]
MMVFENQSSFFAPFWAEDYEAFCRSIEKDSRWKPTPDWQNRPSYFFQYASQIISRKETFRTYIYQGGGLSDIYMFQGYEALEHGFQVHEVRLNVFGTGAGFLEYRVKYGDADLETITQFAYHFKKARTPDTNKNLDRGGKVSLYDFSRRILPDETAQTLFFTSSAEFKYECHSYHMIKVDRGAYSDAELETCLKKLQWTYGKQINMDSADLNGEYNFVYKANAQDWWAGSQESLVDLSIETGDPQLDRFLKNQKMLQLVRDYRMLYLILLNQRYSALYYISQAAENENKPLEFFQKLGYHIARLKNTYSFRLISDDRNYQNLYAELYRIFKIDLLLQDLADNQERLVLLRGEETEKTDRKINLILVVIAVLSLASVLIDASDYLDRWGIDKTVSTIISLAITVLVLVAVLLLFRKKR